MTTTDGIYTVAHSIMVITIIDNYNVIMYCSCCSKNSCLAITYGLGSGNRVSDGALGTTTDLPFLPRTLTIKH